MRILDFHRFEEISSSKKTINSFLNTLPEETSIEEVLEILRLSGSCYNIHSPKQLRTFKQTVTNIEKKFPQDKEKISSFIHTIDNLDAIVSDFFSLRSATEVEKIPKTRQITSFILALEIFVGSTLEYAKGYSIERIKKVYPFVISLFNEKNQKVAKAKDQLEQVYGIIDSIVGFAGSILKFMEIGNRDIGKINTTVSRDQIKIARQHILLYDIWWVLLDLEQSWRFAGSKIIFDDKKRSATVELGNEEFLHGREISFERFLSQKTRWRADFENFYEQHKHKINFKSSELPPTEFISEDEAYYILAVGEFLETYDFNEKCLDVSLSEWIRAYTIIQVEASKHLEERFSDKRVKPLTINNWTIRRDKKYWINLFEKRGISNKSAEIILENLIFTKDSKDLLDCPFISHLDEIILIPSIAASIDPSMSLVSLLTKNEVDISFKGTGLEQRVLRELNKKGIKAISIKRTSDNDTYECDVVFTLNNDLFFIELKAFGQPRTTREYYNLLFKLYGEHNNSKDNKEERSATEQLNRIVKFYEANLNIVREELNLSNKWIPKNIRKVVLTTAKLGNPMFVDDCFIADTSTFFCFLDRKTPGLMFGKRMLRPTHPDFEGEVTSEKLTNVLNNPLQIELFKIIVRKSEREINLDSKTLTYPTFKNMLGNIINPNKKILDMLGIDEEDITNM
ncbi:hypothetical protein A3863_10360 [Priestia endophytica]|uniref:hypothetical protein n=1 Tax=Priestia endophytica TaxID=135735 RepID=UPI000DCA51AF|nr:hypothetical protein [Priestia endophytica]RAS89613.1 hypothetical protein A3863_10360 [Priestia endophytica]